ncbi:hypothetical protein B296_00037316 [Ensete ventricosum]|uniref:Uncharacterized protein n=1 Tax=Ensete ventricosum TaxID=4639 RepID=A0A426Y3U8_ENSVE|nr:hypothetical protein B296_00037316 [Ensete ventricosum]
METSNVEPRREERDLPQIRTHMDANGASSCSFVSRKQRKGCSVLSIKHRSGCLRKAARVLLGLETADAKVHRWSRPTTVDVINNGRIDNGGNKLLGCYRGWEVGERSISAGKEHWQVSPAGEEIATAEEGLAPPRLNRSLDLFGVSRRRRRDMAAKRR